MMIGSPRISTTYRCLNPKTRCNSISSAKMSEDWRSKAKPIPQNSTYPAKENCSQCGLCDTYYVAHVKEACAFLGDGMSKIPEMEKQVHGRSRDLTSLDELHFGVHEEMLYARSTPPIDGAQWTGIVTKIAIAMLENKLVDAVVCVQSDPDNRLEPRPVVALTVEDILASRGVKPSLSPNLRVLATVEALDVKRLLFIGVGCQVQALRAIEPYLNLEKLYVMGTNCVDNGPKEGLQKFLKAASNDPATVTGYEFMQDYRVHIKHLSKSNYEKIPYFCLPANDLSDVIAPSCYSCFDYPNAGADLVIGYMGVPPDSSVEMTEHLQYITVRNKTGREMLDLVASTPTEDGTTSTGGGTSSTASTNGGVELSRKTSSSGSRKSLVMQTVLADDDVKVGRGPSGTAPRWLGEILATVLTWIGPRGIEFARYSIEYHYIRNYIHVMRHWELQRGQHGDRHVPDYVKHIVREYDGRGEIQKRIDMEAPFPGEKRKRG